MNNTVKYNELNEDIDKILNDKINKLVMEIKITENMTVQQGIDQ